MVGKQRLIACGIGVAVGESGVALALALAVGPQAVSAMLAVCAVLTAAISVAISPLLEEAGGPGGAGPSRGEPGGGPDAPEPSWWPQFERELRDHLRERERTPA